MRAMAWIWSRISLLLGKSPGRWRYSTPSCLAALRLAVKYSDSVRWYIIWAARKAIWRRMRSSAMLERCAVFQPIDAARGRKPDGRKDAAGSGKVKGLLHGNLTDGTPGGHRSCHLGRRGRRRQADDELAPLAEALAPGRD